MYVAESYLAQDIKPAKMENTGHLHYKVGVYADCGLHMRPAMAIIDAVQNYDGHVTIRYDDGRKIHEADTRSIMQLSMLAITKGKSFDLVFTEPKNMEQNALKNKIYFEVLKAVSGHYDQ